MRDYKTNPIKRMQNEKQKTFFSPNTFHFLIRIKTQDKNLTSFNTNLLPEHVKPTRSAWKKIHFALFLQHASHLTI